MTTSQIIACAISWTAAPAAAIAATLALRAQQQAQAALIAVRTERRTFSTPDGGVFTFDRRMSDAEVAAFKARWQETYGTPGTAQEGTVCGAYRVPATAEDSGLCAGCGMFDYRHKEESGG